MISRPAFVAIILFIMSVMCIPGFGQTAPATTPSTTATHSDSVRAIAKTPDSTVSISTTDKEKIKIIKRNVDAKRYIALAVGMMIYLALILTTVQTWNPG